jgi:hypothetical protein
MSEPLIISEASPTTITNPPTTTSSTISHPTTRFKFAEDENYLRRNVHREASPPKEQPFNPYLSQGDSEKINQLNVEIEKASRKVDEIAELRNQVEKIDAKRRRKIGK